jgi:adenine-specific DNA-methyltransferase
VEQRIKEKIELIGKPLKEWNINIYRGVLTGYNDAFIIDGNKKQELITIDPKSAEIIRPILRGRDIKRYTHDFADLWIIATFPSLKIDIERYPAIKEHLLGFGYGRLNQSGESGARKKTNNQWFETQDSIMYWEDFSKQKIVWGNLNLKASYSIAPNNMYVSAPCPMIVPASKYLLAFLNSKVADYYVRSLGVTRNGGYFEYKPMFIEKLPIPIGSENTTSMFDDLISTIIQAKQNNVDTGVEEEMIDNMIFDIYNLDEEEKQFIKSQ